jgi:hypothetical protein
MNTTTDEAFSLDRQRFRKYIEGEYGEAEGLDAFCEDGGLSASLAGRIYDARDCDAISAPTNVEVHAYALEDSLVICVREVRDQPGGPLRQIATHSIETKQLASREDDSFDECCLAIEEVLRHASELLPLLRVLQSAERRGTPDQHELPDVTAYHGTDGAVVIEIDSAPVGMARRDIDGVPYLRVYVNERPVSEHSPLEPLAGSTEATDTSDPNAPVGRLAIERSAPSLVNSLCGLVEVAGTTEDANTDRGIRDGNEHRKP